MIRADDSMVHFLALSAALLFVVAASPQKASAITNDAGQNCLAQRLPPKEL
jgi:hypothetical protein